MSISDETVLEAELRQLAESFAVPADGLEVILAQRDQPTRTTARRRWRARVRPQMLAPAFGAAIALGLVAAAVVVGQGPQASQKFSKSGSSIDGVSSPGFAGSVGPTAPLKSPPSGISYGAQAAAGSVAGTAPQAAADGPRIVKTGTLSLIVSAPRFSAVISQLATIAVGSGGYVSASGTSEDSRSPSGHVTLRIPVASFEDVLGHARRLGRVTAVSSEGRDVTADSVDLEARISSLTAARQQYLTLMSKATTVGDVLAVQQQVNDLQTTIEQLQGQKRVLDSRADLSTLEVTLADRKAAVPTADSGLRRAWNRAVGGFVRALEGLLSASGVILFATLAAIAAWFMLRPVWRRVRRWSL